MTRQDISDYVDMLEDMDSSRRDVHFGFFESYLSRDDFDNGAMLHGKPVNGSFIPCIYDYPTRLYLEYVSTTMHGILCKVIGHYKSDSVYADLFGFDSRLRELIELPVQYSQLLPFARLDGFYDFDSPIDDPRFRFCEFNADGCSGMAMSQEVQHGIHNADCYRDYRAVKGLTGVAEGAYPLGVGDYLHAFCRAFNDCFCDSEFEKKNARVAIVDYVDSAVMSEFKKLRDYLNGMGFECVIQDVRQLSYDADNNRLLGYAGIPIDAVVRRCVTNDVLAHWDESKDFLDAVRNGAVCLVGPFHTHIVHDKRIFSMLYRSETQAFLTDEEIALIEKTVPRTVESTGFDDGFLREVMADRESWVLKPVDGYGGHGVIPGRDVTDDEWRKYLEGSVMGPLSYRYLLQEYVVPSVYPVMPAFGPVAGKVCHCNSTTGMYVFDGEFCGAFNRLGFGSAIGASNGFVAPSLWLPCPDPVPGM